MRERISPVRAVSVLAVGILALCLSVWLVGCGGSRASDEDLIRTTIAQVLDTFKDPTEEGLSHYVDVDDVAALGEHGIDTYEFLAHAFSHFDYSIDDVTVDGDAASVDLTITNVDLAAAMGAATAWLEDNPGEWEDALGEDDATNQIMSLMFQRFYDEVDTSEDLVSANVTLSLTKVDGTWQVDDDSLGELSSVVMGDMGL